MDSLHPHHSFALIFTYTLVYRTPCLCVLPPFQRLSLRDYHSPLLSVLGSHKHTIHRDWHAFHATEISRFTRPRLLILASDYQTLVHVQRVFFRTNLNRFQMIGWSRRQNCRGGRYSGAWPKSHNLRRRVSSL